MMVNILGTILFMSLFFMARPALATEPSAKRLKYSSTLKQGFKYSSTLEQGLNSLNRPNFRLKLRKVHLLDLRIMPDMESMDMRLLLAKNFAPNIRFYIYF